jgi:hypothetical protein
MLRHRLPRHRDWVLAHWHRLDASRPILCGVGSQTMAQAITTTVGVVMTGSKRMAKVVISGNSLAWRWFSALTPDVCRHWVAEGKPTAIQNGAIGRKMPYRQVTQAEGITRHDARYLGYHE